MNNENKPTKVVVVGCGYVGLTAAACLADLGHVVVGVENNADRLASLRQGKAPFFEPDLDALVASGQTGNRLSFTEDLTAAVVDADVVLISVPTPSLGDGAADLTIVESVVSTLSKSLPSGAVVVLKSTVPIGTSTQVVGWLGRSDVEVVANPEFLQAGQAVKAFQHPDRVVVGASNKEAGHKVAALYAGLNAPVIITDQRSAELIKYASNTYLALRLSFVNTVATLCEQGGGDATTVLAGMGLDHRIGSAFLQPGPGWGGSCFPKDTRALAAVIRNAEADDTMLEAALAANQKRLRQMVKVATQAVGGSLHGKKIAVLGLTFKAGTDDLRDSPSLAIAKGLVAAGAKVTSYDPMVSVSPEGARHAGSALEAAKEAEVVMVLTEWPEFTELDLSSLAEAMAGNQIIDTRGLLNKESCQDAGLTLWQVGKG
ncbi:MAG: UDP-glucose/GDP-mannose dehydrogenase family protein [Flavobacteriales bacterium]|jgi:UDPglucose 6-dehydrogenase|nr:UDP-glucose/GDP-mannose dehydrogenase family protein [Flavobacteriales bacterium]